MKMSAMSISWKRLCKYCFRSSGVSGSPRIYLDVQREQHRVIPKSGGFWGVFFSERNVHARAYVSLCICVCVSLSVCVCMCVCVRARVYNCVCVVCMHTRSINVVKVRARRITVRRVYRRRISMPLGSAKV